jgi:hypothetical protein
MLANGSKEKQRWEHEVRCLKHSMIFFKLQFHCYIAPSASSISHMFVLYGTDFSTQVLPNEYRKIDILENQIANLKMAQCRTT